MEKYMNGCDICQKIKNQTNTPTEKLMMNEILEMP